MKVKILVYGTLRKGGYNYHAFKNIFGEEINCLGTIKVKGFKLYDLGPFPAIIQGNGEVVFDILEVSRQCFYSITYMEIGAGYECKKVKIDGEEYFLYVFDYMPSGAKLIPSGDYSKHINKKENER